MIYNVSFKSGCKVTIFFSYTQVYAYFFIFYSKNICIYKKNVVPLCAFYNYI